MAVRSSLVAVRYGIGLPLAPDAPQTPEDMLASLARPDHMAIKYPTVSFADIQPLAFFLRKTAAKAKIDPAAREEYDIRYRAMLDLGRTALRANLARVLDSADDFRERLFAFWADHFTIAAGRETAPMPYAFGEDAIRPHIAARFEVLLTGATLHPGMLEYLDQVRSIGPNSSRAESKGGGLNENFARELMELHTLGVGADYSQTDVREMAKLLAGLGYDMRKGYAFNKKRAEPGPKTVLGKTYGDEGEATVREALADLARHPATAQHICRKLAVHFLSDTPDARVILAMVGAWQQSDGDLLAVYRAMLMHPAAWLPNLAKARQPWDFILASLRALGVTGATVVAWDDKVLDTIVLKPLRQMGQIWKTPRGPDGWAEEAEAWITPQGLAERIDWAMTRPARLVKSLPDPTDLAKRALGDLASPAVLWAAERAENRAEGVGIVLASPEFNRR